MRSAERAEAERASQTHRQLAMLLLGSVLCSASTSELDVMYQRLVIDPLTRVRPSLQSRLECYAHLRVVLELLPLARLGDASRRHLNTTLVPSLQAIVTSSRDAAPELVGTRLGVRFV